MPTTTLPHPRIASQAEWLEERKKLLSEEKEHTHQGDRVAANRRRLPMVKIEKEYAFEGQDGKKRLADLFEGRTQLIVYHFMFAPEWDKGCMGCTGFVNALGDLSSLQERNTTFALISLAPWEKLKAYKDLQGWNRPWYSSFGNDFNYDFHVTLDPAIAPAEYNYRTAAEWEAVGRHALRRAPWTQRLLPVGRRRVSQLLVLRTRGGAPDRHVRSARGDALRPPGGLGGLSRGLAATADLWLGAL